jgi:hypothetical protein
MATPIVVGAGTYLVNFAGGQGIPSVSQYFATATDLDLNFSTLQATINSVIDEVKAIAGPNSVLGLDIMVTSDTAILNPVSDTGRIGTSSVIVTINGGDAANLDVSLGPMLLLRNRIDVVAQLVPGVGLGGSPISPAFIAMDANGMCSASAGGGSQLFDIYEAEWDGTVFTSVTSQIETYLDGDEWYEMRTEPVATLFNPDHDPVTPFNPIVKTYLGAHTRLDNIVRYLSGFTDNTDGDASTAQIIAGGSAASPRIGLGDGTVSVAGGTVGEPQIDANAGLYRSAASVLSYSTASTERVRLSVSGLSVLPGSAGTPSLRFHTEAGLGFYRHAANEIGIAANSNDVLLIRETNVRAGVAGSAAQPFYTCDIANRDDSGMYFPDDDSLALGTAGVEAVLIDPTGNLNLPTQSRVKGNKTTSQTMSDGTATNIQFTAADTDEVGAWHTPGADTAGEEFTCPTGADGTYWITINYEWAGPATNGRDHFQEITVTNVAIAKSQRETATGELYEDTITGSTLLSGGDVVRARVTQTDTVGALSLDIESASISIIKVA